MGKGVWVLSSNDRAGKTHFIVTLAHYLRGRDMDVAAVKPLETGHGGDQDAPASDSERFVQELGLPADEASGTVVRFEDDVPPLQAARDQSQNVDIRMLNRAIERALDRHELVLVEGLGGVALPLDGEMLVSDWVRRSAMPAIVVAEEGPTTVNHAVLTVEHLYRHDIEVLAVVLNATSSKTQADAGPNAALIASILGLPVYGPLGYRASSSLAQYVESQEPLLATIARRLLRRDSDAASRRRKG